jgi:hypothetical protein
VSAANTGTSASQADTDGDGDEVARGTDPNDPNSFPRALNDFDGDGKTVMGVYHQAAGNWYIRYSSTGRYLMGFPMGWSESVPVPGDYDGDGMTDTPVYYQAAGAWYVAYSSGGYLLGDTIGWR